MASEPFRGSPLLYQRRFFPRRRTGLATPRHTDKVYYYMANGSCGIAGKWRSCVGAPPARAHQHSVADAIAAASVIPSR